MTVLTLSKMEVVGNITYAQPLSVLLHPGKEGRCAAVHMIRAIYKLDHHHVVNVDAGGRACLAMAAAIAIS